MPPFIESLWNLFQTPVILAHIGSTTYGTSYGEIIANLFGIVCVYLCAKEHILNWPTGILNNFFLIFLFVPGKLYSDAILQIIYIGIAIYGWWAWLHGGTNQTELKITRTPVSTWAILAVIAVIGTGLWGLVAHKYTDTDVPYWDACNTVLCLIAQYMMGRKLLENWPVWIVTNISYIALYWHKGFYVTMLVQFIYIGLSVLGYLEWRKTLLKNQAEDMASSLESSSRRTPDTSPFSNTPEH